MLPERSWEACSLELPLALSPLSTKQKLIGNQNLCKVHRFRGEGRGEAGGPMWADWKTISPINCQGYFYLTMNWEKGPQAWPHYRMEG